jgi:hypothetical protein
MSSCVGYVGFSKTGDIAYPITYSHVGLRRLGYVGYVVFNL